MLETKQLFDAMVVLKTSANAAELTGAMNALGKLMWATQNLAIKRRCLAELQRVRDQTLRAAEAYRAELRRRGLAPELDVGGARAVK